MPPYSGVRQRQEVRQVPEIIGESLHAKHLREFVLQVAPIKSTVLLTGETGVGKDHTAKTIHSIGRPTRPFKEVNCPTIPTTVFESELFGHFKGAFTDARERRVGLVEVVGDGTLFINEIGEMTLDLQAKLLQLLDGKGYRPVGSNYEQDFHGRIIAATNIELRDAVKARGFRLDLFQRLDVFSYRIPALREHPEDIALIAHNFLARQNARKVFTPEAVDALEKYAWPGNIRELEHVVEKGIARSIGDEINLRDIRDFLKEDFETRTISGPSPDQIVGQRLFLEMTKKHGDFWEVVHNPYMSRNLSRDQVRAVIDLALKETRGNYKGVARIFNLEGEGEYKKLLNFLRKHDCHIPFQNYR